jgi:hypothetical protein
MQAAPPESPLAGNTACFVGVIRVTDDFVVKTNEGLAINQTLIYSVVLGGDDGLRSRMDIMLFYFRRSRYGGRAIVCLTRVECQEKAPTIGTSPLVFDYPHRGLDGLHHDYRRAA